MVNMKMMGLFQKLNTTFIYIPFLKHLERNNRGDQCAQLDRIHYFLIVASHCLNFQFGKSCIFLVIPFD